MISIFINFPSKIIGLKMHNIKCLYRMLVSFLFILQVFCNGTRVTTQTNSFDIQWNMAKQLGKKFDASNWVLHRGTTRKDSRWNRIWFDTMKNETSLGYFSMNFPPISNSSNINIVTKLRKSTHVTTLHLFVSSYQQSLKEILFSKSSSGIESYQLLSDVWLVKISEDNETKNNFLNFMNGFKMNLNRNVFCYYLLDNSTIKVFEVFKANPTSNFMLRPYGVWNDKQWSQQNQNELDSNPLSLRGAHLRVVSAYAPPSVT